MLVVRNDALAALCGTDGDRCVLQVDAAGGLFVTLQSQGVEDAAETSAGTLQMVGSVRRDAAASSAGTTGDNATLNTDALGNLWVVSAIVEDVAETVASPLLGVGTVRRDTAASSAGTTGDNATLNIDSTGQLWANVGATVVATGAAAITCGQTDVPGTGTNVQLASNTCKEVYISCETASTGDCFVSHATGSGVTGGMAIPDGSTIGPFKIANTNLLWVDVSNNGDDVGWCCVN